MSVVKKFYVAVLCGLVGAFSLVSSAGAATFPGGNGNIAFSQTTYGVSNIWLINERYQDARQLTHFGAYNPVWSPDGKMMAIARPGGQLQILNERGRLVHWLPFVPGFKDSSPVWSADGSRIAFVRTETGSARSAVFDFNFRTKWLQNVSGWTKVGGYRSPSWAPDGHRIVYEGFRPGHRVLIVKNVVNGIVKELTTLSDDTNSNVAWSPNGKKVMFSDSSYEVYTIWPDGSHRTAISDGDSRGAVWSPDGTELAFIEDQGISISGTNGSVTQVYPGNNDHINNLTWSPDGSRLAFIALKDATSKLWVLQRDNGSVKPVLQTNNQLEALSWQVRR